MQQSNNNNNTTNNNPPSKCSSISLKDQIKIVRDHKKIKCLQTLADKYNCSIDEIQSIIQGKEKSRSILKTNSQLVNLLDKVVFEWFQRAQRLIETGTITDEMFLQKAQESKQIFGIQNFNPNHEWVAKFKKKHNITALDMTLLRIENDNRLLSTDINEIVFHVLGNNPIKGYTTTLTNSQQNSMETGPEMTTSQSQAILNLPDHLGSTNNGESQTLMVFDVVDKPAEVLPVITNDEQARRHLKPLEEYVMLKENFRAIGLISQLEEIFASETN